jgi:hypothetical protein
MTRFRLLFVSCASWTLLALAGCADREPTNATPDHTPQMIAQLHSPASLGVSSVVPASTPAYGALDGASASASGGSLRMSVDAGGPIPRFPDGYIESVAVFGYAWVDGDTGAGLVAVIHPVIGRDSHQNPDGWHTHPVQLTAGAAFNFCIVSIGGSQGGLSLHGDELAVRIAERWAGVSAAALDVAAAFIVRQDAACTATGLGVEVLDTATL